MTNSDNGDQLVNEIIRSIAAEYGWKGYLAKEKIIVKLDQGVFNKYAGKYEFVAAGGNFTVSVEDSKLKIQLGAEKKYELLPESETNFFMREMPLEAIFVKDADGSAKELVIFYTGQEFRLKKIQ